MIDVIQMEESNMNKETIGEKVQIARKMRKYSQEKLGDKAGISQQHLSRIENDKTDPTIDTLLKLSKALNVSITTLTYSEVFILKEKCILDMVSKLELLSMNSKMKVSGYIDCLLHDEMMKAKY